MWMTGCHALYDKMSIKLLKNKKKLFPRGVMPLNDQELHPSSTCGWKNH